MKTKIPKEPPKPIKTIEGSKLFLGKVSEAKGWVLYEEMEGGMRVILARFTNEGAANRFKYWLVKK